MRFNDRARALLDIPDLPIEAFKHCGDRKIKPQGGDGGGTPEKTTQVADLPDWAKPSAQKLLGKAEALTEGAQYQPYRGQRVADFSPLQQQAFQNAVQMDAGPQGFAQNVPQYMSPYMQNVVDIQKREAARQSDILRNQQQAQAVGAGAFGGSRQAIVEAERQRNLGQQLGDIQAQGSQAAYQQAQQQFNAEQQARLAAQQANQQAGLSVGQQNLQALLGVQNLGATQGLAAQQANQQAYQNAQQLAEQSRQYGAGLGLQGLQTALTGAGQLANIGQQQFAQNQDIINLQNQIGAQQTAQQQNILSQQYQDFLNQQSYPYQQLEFMSNILRGTPMGTVNTLYGQQPSAVSQLAGLGTAAYGASQLMADGGEVKASGLADLALSKI